MDTEKKIDRHTSIDTKQTGEPDGRLGGQWKGETFKWQKHAEK